MKYRKVLFVCSGNLCRSPMAEAIFEDMIRNDGGAQSAGIRAQSAGTWDLGCHKATDEAIEVMREKGLDITSHRSRHIDEDLVNWADVILVMEDEHRVYTLARFPNARGKVHLLAELAGEEGEIADPMNCGIAGHRECADRLEFLVGAVVDRISTGKESQKWVRE